MSEAGEIKVLCSTAFAGALKRLAPDLERAAGGRRLAARIGPTAMLGRAIEAGEACDIAILAREAAAAFVAAGRLLAPAVEIARSGVGVAVRAGAPKPDVATPEAFVRAIRAARSIACTTQGASGIHFASLLERLGIADEIKPKCRTQPGGVVAELLVKGEAELAIQQMSELLLVDGIDLVGPLPAELQSVIVLAVAVCSAASAPAAARDAFTLLSSPAAVPAIRDSGLWQP